MDDYFRGALRAVLVITGVFPMCGGIGGALGAETWTGRIIGAAVAVAGFLWVKKANSLWRNG